MILGKTTEQKREERDRKAIAMHKAGVVKFAFLPVKIKNGQTLWLEKYWQDYFETMSVYTITAGHAKDYHNYTLDEAMVIKLTRE